MSRERDLEAEVKRLKADVANLEAEVAADERSWTQDIKDLEENLRDERKEVARLDDQFRRAREALADAGVNLLFDSDDLAEGIRELARRLKEGKGT